MAMVVNKISRALTLVAATAMAVTSPAPGEAQDASFGCKVLLCAAATTPGWSGIPYCVPVMESLLDQLRHGGSLPSCPEGGSESGINYQPYLACPQDTVAGSMVNTNSRDGGSDTWQPSSNGGLCGKKVYVQGNSRDGTSSGWEIQTTARPMRPDPYNVVVTPKAGQPVTVWFSL
jgi:hypothetical protein